MGLPFVESFILETLQEALDMIINLPMFANRQEASTMLSFCYVMTKLPTMYCVSITRYLVTLY
jgi:hypothetical protein